MLERCELFALAESLGGVESLIEHPAIMTHASVPAANRKRLGISDGLIRLSVGVEDIADLRAEEVSRRMASCTAGSRRDHGLVKFYRGSDQASYGQAYIARAVACR
jgi:hypothetical protein